MISVHAKMYYKKILLWDKQTRLGLRPNELT